MNWQYISGFFDADGSITLTRPHKDKKKTIQVSFHNNELQVLEEIQEFVYQKLGVKGSISTKKARKATHKDSYDLKYQFVSALKLVNKLDSIHPKKAHRIKVYNLIQEITPRNGKYTKKLLEQRTKLEEKFWQH